MIDPDCVEIDAQNGRARARYALPADADFLADHFPGAPMLPGLLMLELAVRAAAATVSDASPLGVARDLVSLDRLVVLRRVVPGEVVIVEAQVACGSHVDDPAVVRAFASVDGAPALRARFRLAPISVSHDTPHPTIHGGDTTR